MDKKEIIWIAGGDGLVGKKLVQLIDTSRYAVYILTRKNHTANNLETHYIQWNTDHFTINTNILPDHIINLAGAGIADERWSAARKKLLISSRVNSAKTIQQYIETHNIKPKTYISASAVGFYGHRDDELLTEESNPGNEFMADCCVQWEEAAHEVGTLCDRKIILRIGIVLSAQGGALPKMLMTRKIGVFNYFGNGHQFYPWIHISDLCQLIIDVLHKPEYQGIYNAVAPQQITNKNMMKEILQTNQMKGFLFPAPTFVLKLILGEMSAVILNSNRVSAQKLIDAGFQFQFTDVGTAVKNIIK